jgi:glutaredoxin
MEDSVTPEDTIRVYWQPGCTSCLRTKEFLTRHGVAFESRNVLADEEAFAELARFGLRQVPIVTRGDEWVNGQVLTDVARLAGIELGGLRLLPVSELERRLKAVLAGAERYLAQMPDEALTRMLPNRPRSYADLSYHIFNIADSFLEHDEGIPLTFDSYNRVPAPGESGKPALLDYGRDVSRRLDAWFAGPGRSADWDARADVYYGVQTLHQFLERTTWHAGQHARQLMWVLEQMGIAPAGELGPEMWVGLPMPEKVWDDEKAA